MRCAPRLLALAVSLVSAACASTGVDQAAAVAEKLRSLNAELEKAKTAIDESLGALQQFNASGDLKAQYKAYSEKLKALDSQAAEIKSLRAGFQEKKEGYVKGWQEKQAAITNPDLRKKSEERKDELVKRFESLATKSDEARKEYEDMRKNLGDVQSYLEHDLNKTGLDAISGTAKDAGKGGVKVRRSLDEIIADVKKLADDMDVPPPPPPPAPAEGEKKK